MEGGKNGPAQSFPIPIFRRIIWLNACNLNFSLGYVNMSLISVQIQCKSSLNKKTDR